VAFKVGNPVQEIAPPHRKGTVRAVKGSGLQADVTVNLTGWHPVTLKASQIKLT
jgi:hypothetical protein